MFKRILILSATALLLTACSYGAAQPQTDTNTTQPQAGASMIDIKSFAFNPNQITVKPGAQVTVTNSDVTGHSVTSDDAKSFDTTVLEPGKSVVITAPTTPGSYSFHCAIHPSMKGTLVVK